MPDHMLCDYYWPKLGQYISSASASLFLAVIPIPRGQRTVWSNFDGLQEQRVD